MKNKPKIILISMPWSRMDITSIQIGSLKVFLKERGYDVEVRYYYKDIVGYIGMDVYNTMQNIILGEIFFSIYLYPEKRETIKKVFFEKSEGKIDFDLLEENVSKYISDILDDVDWEDFDVIGFTTSLVQLMPSLYLAKILKERYTHLITVFGGASMVGQMAMNLLSSLDMVDYIVKDEGELTFEALLETLWQDDRNVEDISGVVYRDGEKVVSNPDRPMMEDLDKLPYPDFDEYFSKKLPSSMSVHPKIAVEASRGCFWSGCTFCNLNCQWHKSYRKKSADKVVNEIVHQTTKYQTLDIFFTDANISDKRELFTKLSKVNRNFRLHAEVSGHLEREDLLIMRKAGLVDIQIGIEAFSNSLLKKYNKGVTLMRNIELIKWCAEFGIKLFYNVIAEFPTTTQEEIDETFHNFKYAQFFQPPVVTKYTLSYDSEVYNNYGKYNIKDWKIPTYLEAVYPEDIVDKISPLLVTIIGYEAVIKEEISTDWSKVVEFEKIWINNFETNNEKSGFIFYDGEEYAIVEKNYYSHTEHLILPRSYRDIYLYCIEKSKELNRISKRFSDIECKKIKEMLDEMYDLEIVFREEDKYFSLATPVKELGW